MVKVTKQFASADALSITLWKGLVGVVERLDEDGDAWIVFPDIGPQDIAQNAVFKANFPLLEVLHCHSDSE